TFAENHMVKIFVLALLLTLHAASTVRYQSPPSLTLKDCQIKGLQGSAKCGTLEVFENRATKKGRKISLNIIVLPATSDKREPDPLVYFAGGPGSAATEDAVGIAMAFPQIREHRDLLFVDQRGTGKSHPLDCQM